MKTLTWQKPGQQNVAQELIKIIINYVAELRKVKGARDRRVVISLQGVIAMAMATLSPDLIEVIEEPKKK